MHRHPELVLEGVVVRAVELKRVDHVVHSMPHTVFDGRLCTRVEGAVGADRDLVSVPDPLDERVARRAVHSLGPP